MRKIVFGMLVLSGCAAMGQPKLVVEGGTNLDLGTIIRGKVVEKKLTLKNNGNQPLYLGRVEASCGCTGTLVSSDTIAPGKTGTLKITFNSKNFNGPIHKTVTINSNSAEEPRTVVEFSGTVNEEVAVTPTQFWFRDAEVGKASNSFITVQNKGKIDLTLTGFSTQLDGFSLKLPTQPVKPGQTVQVEAEFVPKTARTVLSDGVILKTDNPHQPEVYIYIYGSIREFKFQ
jgi:Protein of unknown function (DUF1573)/HYDIN/CFA65/VesB-like, Ig-like domain